MQTSPDSPRVSRQGLLTAVMFVLLLLSVGAAWLLTRGRGSPTRAAMNVLEQIRADGLGAHWEGQTVRWYVIRANGKPVGWRLLLRAGRDDGGFEGLEFIVAGNAPRRSVNWWHWSLNADATKGVYVAQALSRRNFGKTIVKLGNGRIVIQQELKSGLFTSAASVPPTYLPPGLMRLAYSLVARNKSQATFKTTIDSRRPSGTKPDFAFANIRYAAPDDAGGASLAVRMGGDSTGNATMLYMDDRGELVRTVTEITVEDIADYDEVRAIFGDTANLKYILRRIGVYKTAAGLAARLLPHETERTEDGPDEDTEDDPD